MKNLKLAYLVGFGLLTYSFYSSANQAQLTQLAERIIELRSEVENLNTEFLALKTDKSNELKSRGSRISNLEVQIGQEEVRKKQATQKLLALKEQIEKSSSSGDSLKPVIVKNMADLKQYIRQGLPFQKEKRLREVNDIESKLEANIITEENALARTWSLVEDEMRLTKENALHRQTILLNAEERLATVAKIGMVLMYFHTSDNKVGYVSRNQTGNYLFVEEKRKERSKLIFKLIDGLKKQIRHGRYDLPLAVN
jgi:hypothetical protein